MKNIKTQVLGYSINKSELKQKPECHTRSQVTEKEEKIIKHLWRKGQNTVKETANETEDFLTFTVEAGDNGMIAADQNHALRMNVKIFSDKQKLRDFVTSRFTLKGIINGIL